MKNIIGITAIILLLSSCTNDDTIFPESSSYSVQQGVPFTATIKSGNTEGITRAVAENGSTIEANWATNEYVALIYEVNGVKYNTTATVTYVDEDKNATIEATLHSGVADGTSVTLIYPASAADGNTGNILASVISAQDGALSENRDIRKGIGVISVKELASLSGRTTLNAEYAICKINLSNNNNPLYADGTHPLFIRDDVGNLISTITPTSSTNVLYVSLPSSLTTTTFVLQTATGKYIKQGNASLEAGNFYQPNVTMTGLTRMYSAVSADIGKVIATDGFIYDNSSLAIAAGTATSAMIAYVGSATAPTTDNLYASMSGYSHGLAVALTDVKNTSGAEGSVKLSGTNAVTSAGKYLRKRPTGASAWFLPTAYQWERVFNACGGGTPQKRFSDNMSFSCGSFNSKLSACGGTTVKYDSYWTNTPVDIDPFIFSLRYDFSSQKFYFENKSNSHYVRPFFAF